MTNIRHSFSYDKHFFMGKSISTHDIAISAAWNTIFYCVTDSIVNSVASNLFVISAIHAWKRKDIFYQILFTYIVFMAFFCVNVFVRFAEMYCSASICFAISLLPFSAFLFLFIIVIRPTLFSSVSANLSKAKTFFAFIRQAMWPC